MTSLSKHIYPYLNLFLLQNLNFAILQFDLVFESVEVMIIFSVHNGRFSLE